MPVKLKLNSKREKSKLIIIKKQKMARYLSKGLRLSEACVLAHVSKTELLTMRSDVDFEDFVQRCQAALESDHLSNISEAGAIDWKASAWFLERLYPEKYGKKDTIEHKYEIKIATFQNVVLQVINECSPQLKQKIMQRLKKVDLDNPLAIEHHAKAHVEEHSDKIIDVEYE
jgi:urease gamma subunit